MKLTRTSEGHLLIWERGMERFTLGYRISRGLKRFRLRRNVITIRPLSIHLVRWPMTEVEKRTRFGKPR